MAIIGREAPADIVIPMQTISARHARITALPNGGYELEDLGSTNGTYVNGIRITGPQLVTSSDNIRLGSHIFSIQQYINQIGGGGYIQQPMYPARSNQPGAEYYNQQPHQQMSPSQMAPQGAQAGDGGVRVNVVQQGASQGILDKSYVSAAVITMLLYFVLWLPGLIVNIVYLLEADKFKKRTGESPSGYGCLVALLIFGLLPIIGLILSLAGLFSLPFLTR